MNVIVYVICIFMVKHKHEIVIKKEYIILGLNKIRGFKVPTSIAMELKR